VYFGFQSLRTEDKQPEKSGLNFMKGGTITVLEYLPGSVHLRDFCFKFVSVFHPETPEKLKHASSQVTDKG